MSKKAKILGTHTVEGGIETDALTFKGKAYRARAVPGRDRSYWIRKGEDWTSVEAASLDQDIQDRLDDAIEAAWPMGTKSWEDSPASQARCLPPVQPTTGRTARPDERAERCLACTAALDAHENGRCS